MTETFLEPGEISEAFDNVSKLHRTLLPLLCSRSVPVPLSYINPSTFFERLRTAIQAHAPSRNNEDYLYSFGSHHPVMDEVDTRPTPVDWHAAVNGVPSFADDIYPSHICTNLVLQAPAPSPLP